MLEFLTRVEAWYAERVSKFLTELHTDKDLAGATLLDKTLVPYVTEVGTRYHNWDPCRSCSSAVRAPASRAVSTGAAAAACARPTISGWPARTSSASPDFTLGDSDMHTTALTGVFK